MDFVEATKTCLRKYATFGGRASRSEYWWFFLFGLLVGAAASLFSERLNALVSLFLLLPSTAVGARRLHDIGRSGWWLLLWLVPVIGWIPLLYWAVQPSGPANQYGSGPELPRDDPLGIPPGV
jgi:uncharacterized membrane protein YhaH (DUF805 family)